MYISATTYRAQTGVLEVPLTYVCAHCGAQANSIVQTQGQGSSVRLYGIGDGSEDARRAALAAAQRNAHSAFYSAACPGCGALQPGILAEYERAAKELESRRRKRWLWSIAAAVVVSAPLGLAAAGELRYTFAPLAFSLGAGVAAWGGIFAAFSAKKKVTRPNSGSVWFWWTAPNMDSEYRGQSPEPTWLPAPPPVFVPSVKQPSTLAMLAAVLAVVIGGVTAFGGAIAWAGSTDPVYIVSPTGAAMTVKIDGVQVGTVPAAVEAGSDVAWRRFSIHDGAVRSVEIQIAGRDKQTYAIDPTKRPHQGFIIAPDAVANDLCMVSEAVHYGRVSSKGDHADVLLIEGQAFAPLSQSYDDVFTKPPASVQGQRSSGVTRYALRGFSCDGLTENQEIPFAKKPAAR